MRNRAPLSRKAFTLVELLVVIAIIALLIAIALPVLATVKKAAQLRAAEAQMQAIGAACEVYAGTYGGQYPGYFANAEFSKGANRTKFSETENLVLSLMGQVNNKPGTKVDLLGFPAFPSGYGVHPEYVGAGPLSPAGRVVDAFYTPKSRELVAVSGAGNNNDMPEFVDPAAGVPVLYYRLAAVNSKPVDNHAVPGSSSSPTSGRVGRLNNGMYLDATELGSSRNQTYDQSGNSLLAGGATANDQLAWLLIDAAQSELGNGPNSPDGKDVIPGGFVMISAGTDGIYFDKANGNIATSADLNGVVSANDDQVFIGGSK